MWLGVAGFAFIPAGSGKEFKSEPFSSFKMRNWPSSVDETRRSFTIVAPTIGGEFTSVCQITDPVTRSSAMNTPFAFVKSNMLIQSYATTRKLVDIAITVIATAPR